jgi:hypothetical protein
MKTNIFQRIKKGISQKLARKKNSLPKQSNILNFNINRATLKEFSEYRKAIKEKNNLATGVTFASTLVDMSSKTVNTTILPSESDLTKIYEEFLKNSNNTSLYIPEKGQIFVTDDNLITFTQTYEDIIKNYSNNQYLPYNMSLERFNSEQVKKVVTNTKIILMPKHGITRALYYLGHYSQAILPTNHVINAVTYAKAAKVTGLTLFRTHPLLLLAVPTVTAVGLYGFSALVGDNNTVGRALNFGGYIMMTPMRYCELVFNTYCTPRVFAITGIPVVLNFTKTLEVGHGIESDDIQRYIGKILKK